MVSKRLISAVVPAAMSAVLTAASPASADEPSPSPQKPTVDGSLYAPSQRTFNSGDEDKRYTFVSPLNFPSAFNTNSAAFSIGVDVTYGASEETDRKNATLFTPHGGVDLELRLNENLGLYALAKGDLTGGTYNNGKIWFYGQNHAHLEAGYNIVLYRNDKLGTQVAVRGAIEGWWRNKMIVDSSPIELSLDVLERLYSDVLYKKEVNGWGFTNSVNTAQKLGPASLQTSLAYTTGRKVTDTYNAGNYHKLNGGGALGLSIPNTPVTLQGEYYLEWQKDSPVVSHYVGGGACLTKKDASLTACVRVGDKMSFSAHALVDSGNVTVFKQGDTLNTDLKLQWYF